MTGKERIMRILNREEVDRSAYWLGNPHDDALKIYLKHFGIKSLFELADLMGNDMFWQPCDSYDHPEGRPMWDVRGGEKQISFAQDGVFANAESVEEIEAFPYWPDPDYVNFNWFLLQQDIVKDKDYAVFSGTWAPVWHILMDFFGMENCFIKMYTNPDVVKAVMKKMVDFYLEINQRFFDEHADKVDVFFFGNDMGSQLDCMISPDTFRELIFPFYRQLIDLAKSYGKKVALHSYGSVNRIIPDIIGMGVDILHPIQAKAANMGAEHLQVAYGGKIVFLGGVDTQELLPFGTVDDVEKEVLRLRHIFGKNYICSPSHEALLPNVSAEKLLIMSRTATRII
jgi:uroporphyrinogen decarboxylase